MSDNQSIITFSHLRWDFVYQRPQHLMARLAKERRILFIEEPLYKADCTPTWECNSPAPNILVCRLRTPIPAAGFHDDHLPSFIPLLERLLAEQSVKDYLTWLYTPLALPIAQSLNPRAVIYDCMDELSAFRNAPSKLIERETALLQWADLVFTGGHSLYRAKRNRHPNVYCFPSSVDAAHFQQALNPLIEDPDQATLSHPRLGFYGVIDERLDPTLIEALASTHPAWQIMMVGPVAKIDRASLPTHSNIHYLGQRSYAQLPAYLAGWDVCMLPFAHNEATRFISPTKTLEYMAAERPIVSTSIADVVESYGDIVYLGDTPAAFVAACEQALSASAAEHASRVAKMRAVLTHTSWDATAQAMQRLIEAMINTGRTCSLANESGIAFAGRLATEAAGYTTEGRDGGLMVFDNQHR